MLVARFAEAVTAAGYGLVQSPMFEEIGVFQRVGQGTDVVRKEMYDFHDKGDRHLALRPEGTASIVRAYVQHRPALPFKAWYVAPSFRYERPQAGRMRQHHQLGVEAIGSDDPELDVEIITLGWDYLRSLGLQQIRVLVNTMGTREERTRYTADLAGWLSERIDLLDPADRDKVDGSSDARARFEEGGHEGRGRRCAAHRRRDRCHLPRPVRKGARRPRRPRRAIRADAVAGSRPRLLHPHDLRDRFRCARRRAEHPAWRWPLRRARRGDGRTQTPGIGFGSGIERVLLACDAEGVFPTPGHGTEVYVVDTTGGAEARRVTAQLRRAGIGVDRAFDRRSMRAQMKGADRSGAEIAVIIGPEELADGAATLRSLRAAAGTMPRCNVAWRVPTCSTKCGSRSGTAASTHRTRNHDPDIRIQRHRGRSPQRLLRGTRAATTSAGGTRRRLGRATA